MRQWIWLLAVIETLLLTASPGQASPNPQLALCDKLPQTLGEAEQWRIRQALINSFPVRYFDILSRVQIEKSQDESLLGPLVRTTIGTPGPPTIRVPKAFLPKQCRMLLFQVYHLSGYADGASAVRRDAVACIRRGGGRSACLDASVSAYLSNARPLPEKPEDPFSLKQFLAAAPWLNVQFLMAHEAGHIVQQAKDGSVTGGTELEADLLALQSVISDGTVPIGLLAGQATTSLIDEVVPAGEHGSAACRTVRSLQITRRLLPKVLLLTVAIMVPEAFAKAENQKDLSDTADLAMSPAVNCKPYDPARFDAMEADLAGLLPIARQFSEGARTLASLQPLSTALAGFSPATPEGLKWKTTLTFGITIKAGMPAAQNSEGFRRFYDSMEPVFRGSDLTSLSPTNFAALHYFRALFEYFMQPSGTSAVANAKKLVAQFDAAQRYFPLDGPAFQLAAGRMNKKDSGIPGIRDDLDAAGLLFMKLFYTMGRVVAQGCGNAAEVMKPFAELNPSAIDADVTAACLELRRSTIESQVKSSGWTVD